MRGSHPPPINGTVKDSLELAGVALLLYWMFDSVAVQRQPDWAVFWLALAGLAAWIAFFPRCIRALEQFIDSGRDRIAAHDGPGHG